MQAESEKNFQFTAEDVKRIAASPEARQLFRLMQSKSPSAVEKAAEAVKHGDYEAAKSLVSDLQKDAQAEQLLRKLERQR